MTSWRAQKTLEDDFQEEKYFNDQDEELPENKQNQDDDYVDPLDAFMQDIEVKAKEDQQNIGKDLKRKQQEFMIQEDPLDQYMDSVKKKLITEQNKRGGKPQKTGEDGDEEEDLGDYKFLDSDGEVDFKAVKKMKKQNFSLLDREDHTKIKYEPFEKNFYIEHEDIQNMTEEQLKSYRDKEQIRVKGLACPKPVISFGHCNFDDSMIGQMTKQGFQKPTGIQSQALPCILSGRDVVGVAKTGSGKTLAYIWPMLIHILDQRGIEKNEGPISIVLCPTRELTQQVYIECKKYTRLYNIECTALLGGENKKDQWKSLKAGVDIIIATPGRLMEMVQKKATNLQRVTYAVVDEADKMFSMGFEKQIRSILDNIRPDRQTLLFTATLKKSIQNLVMDVLTDPVTINSGVPNQANEDVKQEVVVLRNQADKLVWLKDYLMTFMARGKVIIFVNQIGQCNQLANEIALATGYQDILVLHGDKLQQERTQIINRFKGDSMVMIATDVASRGLDVPQIRTVINYEAPKDSDTHIHRVGRTGRAGDRMGTAYSLLTDMDIKFAVMLIRNFQNSGQTVTPELETVAMKDDKFKLKKQTQNLGLQFAKGKDASRLLKQALNRQRKTKEGLGYSEPKKLSQNEKFEQQANEMIKQQREKMLVEQREAHMQMLQTQQEKQLNQQMRSQFTKPQSQNQDMKIQENQIVPKRGFSRTVTQEMQQQQMSVADERERVRQEYMQRLKSQQQMSFRSAFKSSGVQKSSQDKLPTVQYFTKGKK